MAHALLTEEIAKNDIKNANEFRKNFLPFFIFKNLLFFIAVKENDALQSAFPAAGQIHCLLITYCSSRFSQNPV